MEDIGDYLYLIIVAIAGIGSFLKNINKKKEMSKVPEVEVDEEVEYEYEEVPQEVFVPKPAQRPEVVFERNFTEMTKSPHETIVSFDNTTDFSKLKAKKEVAKTITPKSKAKVEIMEESESIYRINTVEEARAAFIASEIFNRKY